MVHAVLRAFISNGTLQSQHHRAINEFCRKLRMLVWPILNQWPLWPCPKPVAINSTANAGCTCTSHSQSQWRCSSCPGRPTCPKHPSHSRTIHPTAAQTCSPGPSAARHNRNGTSFAGIPWRRQSSSHAAASRLCPSAAERRIWFETDL